MRSQVLGARWLWGARWFWVSPEKLLEGVSEGDELLVKEPEDDAKEASDGEPAK